MTKEERNREERRAEITRITNLLHDATYGSNRSDVLVSLLLTTSTVIEEFEEHSPRYVLGLRDLKLQIDSHIHAAMSVWGFKWATVKIQTEKTEETKHEKHCRQRKRAAPGTETTPA